MFPSGNNYNTMPGISFSGDKHPAGSSLDEYDHIHPIPSSFFHFPTPFSVDHDHGDDGLLMGHFLSQQIMVAPPPDSQVDAPPSPIKETKKIPTSRKRSTITGAKQGIPRKRTGKKDRHSKIYTAHGPRDRRMRLSLQIARKFFDLQDMLCFDKASKTIEWLFSKSKSAIKELTENMPAALKHSVSSTSESEVVSAAKCRGVLTRGESLRSTATGRVTKGKSSRKVVFNHHVAKESRDKARERARERTREKMKMRGLEIFDKTNKCSDECNPNEFLVEIGENSGPAAEEEEKPHHITEQQMDYVGTIENFLGLTRSSSMFNYSNNIAHSAGENSAENCPIISGNWGMNNERFQYSYCAMTNMKDSAGNTQEQNPNSYAKMMNPSNVHEGKNPTSILMSTSDIGLHSDYHENPGVASKIFHNFY